MDNISENMEFSPAGNKDTANMQQPACRPGSATKDHHLTQKEREERIKQLKEKQNEDRQKKLEDLKAQALATQKFREQKDEERRKRIDDLKSRDSDKRTQVEERKRAIWEAEKERREYILRKNMERDQRMDSKRKNERSQIAFAFGSSTPRMLDSESGSMWANRRASSIQNVAYNTSISPITRRSAERDMGDGSKKRAISASGLDRQTEDDSCDMTRSYSAGRRKTDLMPTIPSPRDTCRSSLGTYTPRTPGSRSGEITPKSMTTSMSRPGSAMSTSTTNSGLVVTKRTTPVRKSRPVSIAVTGVSKDEKPPVAPPSGQKSSMKRTSSATTKTPTGSASETPKARPSSAKATPKSSNTPSILSPSVEHPPSIIQQVVTAAKEVIVDDATKSEKTIINNVIKAEQQHTEASFNGTHELVKEVTEIVAPIVATQPKKEVVAPKPAEVVAPKPAEVAAQKPAEVVVQKPAEVVAEKIENPLENADMTSSMMSKSRITTEEEAKAAIAERRRMAREEAERQAEIERKRVEEEEAAEHQRQLEEEERQRQLETETLRLAGEQRLLEEERLQQAIKENEKREEEEKKRKEEEARQKIEREEAEKKAREEAEKAKAETAERLRKEEKEREERRKRVEAIMARTRKGGNANTPSKNESDVVDMSKSQIDLMSQSMIEQTLNTEQSNTDSNQTDQSPPATSPQQDYEQSVTEKENLLMSSFNKMNLNGNGNGLNNNLIETNNNLNLLNGQQNGKSDVPTSDFIIGDGGIATNGHEKNSIESAFTPSDASGIPTKSNEDKLIDFGGSDATITNSEQTSTNLNNNFIDSNSSLITHNLNNNLVAASENIDDRDLSLL